MSSPPVLVVVVCPSCSGCGCTEAPPRYRMPCDTCGGSGRCSAQLAEGDDVADTERPPPDAGVA